MGLFDRNKNTGGLADIIRCDEPNYLIWKWHPAGSQAGTNKRENEIRWGSSLRVKDGEVAVFVYKQKDGTMQDFIEGPFDQTIKTKNFPVLSSLLGLAFDGKSPFQAEVYFINIARLVQIKFGVPYFDIYDPRLVDYCIPVAVRGSISFGITDYREFVKLHRMDTFTLNDFEKQIRDAVCRYVKDAVANVPAAHNIPAVQIESKIGMINDVVETDLCNRLKESFGVTASGVDIAVIEIDKTSASYRELMVLTKDVAAATLHAQTTANIKDIHDKQRIDAEHYQESLRVQREESQYAQHMHTRQTNLGAYQTQKQAEVGIAGAEALGKMGENGVGSIHMGDGGGMGFNPATLMANMALGSVVGKNIGDTMATAMNGMNPGAVPPPIPVVAYHVAINGQAAGPYDLAALKQMASAGQFTATSLVWKAGMVEWAKAETVAELAPVLGEIPPAIPT